MESNSLNYSIQPIAGSLDFEQARHLLDRCLFGAKKSEIDSLVGKPISDALTILTAAPAEPPLPLGMNSKDLDVPIGTTWINASSNSSYYSYRQKSLRAWWIGNMMQQSVSIHEKMVLFWHNHFSTEINVVSNPIFLYQYNMLIRKYALGNFKQFLYEMSITPAMLVYLNGDSNKVGAPNENFARELLELFTIGKGPLISDGNYTNYTETDIKEASKVLTGWKIDRTKNIPFYNTARHDKTTKSFSDAFDKAIISNKEADEYKSLIDLILSKKETARYIARKIYRWFVYYKIDTSIESQIIENMATTLIANNYEIKPVLIQLLGSEHFFSANYRGAYIKNPLEFSIGIYRKLEIQLSPAVLTNCEIWSVIYTSAFNMEMALGDPPDVSGWPQYYKEPSYNELWINTATVPARTSYSDTLCNPGITKFSFKFIIDPMLLAMQLKTPSDPTSLVTESVQLLFPITISSTKISQLKDILIPGLPDSTWTFEWNKYIANPSETTQKALIKGKLTSLIAAMLKMPEFYLC